MEAKSKMGRPREFDENAALDAAIRVFWQKSYEGATMADLTGAMGINRSSMYAAFGDKEALFRRAIERYYEGPMAFIGKALEEPTLREVVTGLLHGSVKFLSQSDHPHGCLSIQGAIACGDDAEPVKQSMIAWRRNGEEALRKRIVRAQRAGELAKGIKPADFAGYLSTVMTGLAIQAANGATPDQMKRIADMTLSCMRFE